MRPLAVTVALAVAAACRGPADPYPLTTVVPDQPRADVPVGGTVQSMAYIPGSRDVVFAAAPPVDAAAASVVLYRAVVDAGNRLTGDVVAFATLSLPDGAPPASVISPVRVRIAADDTAARIVVLASLPATARAGAAADADAAAWTTVFWRLDPRGTLKGSGILPTTPSFFGGAHEGSGSPVERVELGPRSRAAVVFASGDIAFYDLSSNHPAGPAHIGRAFASDAVAVAWRTSDARLAVGFVPDDADGVAGTLALVDGSSGAVRTVPVPARPMPWFTASGRLRLALAVDARTQAQPGMILDGATGKPEARLAVVEASADSWPVRLEVDWAAAVAVPSPAGLGPQRLDWLRACSGPAAAPPGERTPGDALVVAASAASSLPGAGAPPHFQAIYHLIGDLAAAPAAARAELLLPDAVPPSALASCARGALAWPIDRGEEDALAAADIPFHIADALAVADARPWRRQRGTAVIPAADVPSARAACVEAAEHDVLFLAVGFAPRIYRARTAGPPTFALTGQLALFATLAERGFAHTADGWPTEPYPAIGPIACGPDGRVAAVLAMQPPPDVEAPVGDIVEGFVDAPPPPVSQDLILFNADGVIERRAAVAESPLDGAADVAGRSDADRFGVDAIVELSWSPDGRHVAVRRASGWIEVWAMPALSFTRVARVVAPVAVAAAASTPPIVWSPDGRLFAVVGRRVDGADPPPVASVHLFAIDPDGISSPGAFGGQGLATWAWFAEDGSALRYLEWVLYGAGDAGTGGNLVASGVDLAVQPLAARPLRAPIPVADSSELPAHAFAHDGIDWLVVPGGLAVLHDPTSALPDARIVAPSDALRWGRAAHQHGTTGLLAADPLPGLLILRPDGLMPYVAGGGALPADPRRLVIARPMPRRADLGAAPRP